MVEKYFLNMKNLYNPTNFNLELFLKETSPFAQYLNRSKTLFGKKYDQNETSLEINAEYFKHYKYFFSSKIKDNILIEYLYSLNFEPEFINKNHIIFFTNGAFESISEEPFEFGLDHSLACRKMKEKNQLYFYHRITGEKFQNK